MKHTEKGNYSIAKTTCDCGNKHETRLYSLICKDTTSCGCLQREKCSERFKQMNTTHNMNKTRLYRIYSMMVRRCHSEWDKDYKYYGGRGVIVCDEWRSDLKAFVEWALANGYEDDLSIDRIDNDGNYEPSNCRFINHKDQCNNRSTNQLLTAFGETKTITQWAEDERCRVEYQTLWCRYVRYGWDAQKAIATPSLIPRK